MQSFTIKEKKVYKRRTYTLNAYIKEFLNKKPKFLAKLLTVEETL